MRGGKLVIAQGATMDIPNDLTGVDLPGFDSDAESGNLTHFLNFVLLILINLINIGVYNQGTMTIDIEQNYRADITANVFNYGSIDNNL